MKGIGGSSEASPLAAFRNIIMPTAIKALSETERQKLELFDPPQAESSQDLAARLGLYKSRKPAMEEVLK